MVRYLNAGTLSAVSWCIQLTQMLRCRDTLSSPRGIKTFHTGIGKPAQLAGSRQLPLRSMIRHLRRTRCLRIWFYSHPCILRFLHDPCCHHRACRCRRAAKAPQKA